MLNIAEKSKARIIVCIVDRWNIRTMNATMKTRLARYSVLLPKNIFEPSTFGIGSML